jgi:uncharacterized phage protein gp47/JayE
MPFARPTLASLFQRALSYFQTRLASDAFLRRANVRVVAKVLGKLVDGCYGYLDYLSTEIIPDTAVDYLPRWAFLYNKPQNPAVAATGNAIFSGTAGTPIVEGTVLARADGALFTTTAIASVGDDGTVSVPVAAEAAGSAGNTPANTTLTLAVAVTNLNGQATVDGNGLSGGADAESVTAWRARLLLRIRQPPQGGAATDYVQWVLDNFPAATRAWSFPQWMGLGTVGVAFVEDNNPSSIIPSGGDVSAVQNIIGVYGGWPQGVRPVTAEAVVFAPTPETLALTIGLYPNNASTQAAVTAALQALIQREATPGGWVDPVSGNVGGTLLFSHIELAVETAEGVIDSAVTVPSGNVTVGRGQLTVLGAITFNTLSI